MGVAPGSPAEKAGLKGGGDSPDTIVAVDGGVCGVERTAMVTPNRIIPTTATTHVMIARTFLRRGMMTVGLSTLPASSRFDAGAASAGASRPE